ncbi:MAG: replication initiation protein [Bacteroidota bacterium]
MAKKRTKKKNKGIVLIKKSNNLIESRYKFDIWETRFFLSVLSQIRRDDEEFKVYRIRYRDVIKTFGLKSGDSYRYLREAGKSLMNKSFYVKYEKNGTGREKQYHILRELDYLQVGEEGRAPSSEEYIDVVIEQKMKPLLLQLQRNFTAYDLQNVVDLGVYPVRVYELLKQYQSIGKRTLTIAEMKEMFEVKDKYKMFADFNRWIVKPAVKEINKHTDLIVFEVSKIKEGRSVVALCFEFREKSKEEKAKMQGGSNESIQQQQLLLQFEEQNQESEIEETKADALFSKYHAQLKASFGVTPSKFMQALRVDPRIDEARIEKAMRVTRRAKANGEIRKSVPGFFIFCLKEEYTDHQEEQRNKKKTQAAKSAAIRQQLQHLEIEKNNRINDRIRTVVEEAPNITAQAIEALQSNSLTGKMIANKAEVLGRVLTIEDYRQDASLRELVKIKIIELAKDRFADILADYERQKKMLKRQR